MSQTPQDDFVARLRGAYDHHPAHNAPRIPHTAPTSAAKRRSRARRWVGIGAVVATAAAVPIAASSVIGDRGPAPAMPATGSSQTTERSPAYGDDAEQPPRCRATELVVRVGADQLLPGSRQGQIVRLTTTGDRVCRIDARVSATVSVGPRDEPDPPVRTAVDVPREEPFVIAPGRSVAFMISAPQCVEPYSPRGGAPRSFMQRFRVEAGVAGIEVGRPLSSAGTCGDLSVDWVVQEGFAQTADAVEPYALTGRITAPVGFAVGQLSRVVATIENPTERPQTLSRCALRVLPGLGLQIAPPACDEASLTIPPGETRRLTIRQQPMGAGIAGRSFAFTVDGVAAPVRSVVVQPRG